MFARPRACFIALLAVLFTTGAAQAIPTDQAQASNARSTAPDRDLRLVGKVIRVTDGDTISVQLDSGPINVRFDGIDAPERDQPFGSEATRALESLVAGRSVALQVVSQDRYERLVAIVFVDETNVNAELVKSGHAWAYRKYLRDPTYCYLEDGARNLRLGLWQLRPDALQAPWEWRAFKRGHLQVFHDYSRESAVQCVSARQGTTS